VAHQPLIRIRWLPTPVDNPLQDASERTVHASHESQRSELRGGRAQIISGHDGPLM